MRVLIVHYHLKPGGVSSVIRRQVSALLGLGYEASLLLGEAPAANTTGSGSVAGVPLVVEPALGYDQGDKSDKSADSSEPRIQAIAAAVLSLAGPPSADLVVHVHNPTIRKNSALLPALSLLAAKGYSLVLHVHDLAEDWRPDVYSPLEYPQPATWACINQRDARNLRAAGAARVHFLPNAAFAGPSPDAKADRGPAGAGDPEPAASDQALILYPVRGIRRKNLGESILLSLYLPQGLSLGITLPPNNPRDFPFYQGWKAAASAFGAPVGFELGVDADFNLLYARAKAVVSTSVKEGFGLSFLEPLSRGKPVLGRRLPAVIDDFEESGLRFTGLYQRIALPRDLFDRETLAHRTEAAVRAAARAYGLEGLDLARSVVQDLADTPDFGRLDETAQAEVLSRLAADPGAKAAVRDANPFLENWWQASAEPAAPVSLAPWSEASYASRLEGLYQSVRETGGGSPPDKAALLALYLNPEGFYGVGI